MTTARYVKGKRGAVRQATVTSKRQGQAYTVTIAYETPGGDEEHHLYLTAEEQLELVLDLLGKLPVNTLLASERLAKLIQFVQA
jgi:hypothetical protein